MRRVDDPDLSPRPPLPASPRNRGRMLKVERLWPGWMVAVVQVAIVISVLVLWEIAGRGEWIDAFFWSTPTKIFETFKVFVSSGSAYVDTWFTFRSTVLAFAFGTLLGALIGLSFLVVAQLRQRCATVPRMLRGNSEAGACSSYRADVRYRYSVQGRNRNCADSSRDNAYDLRCGSYRRCQFAKASMYSLGATRWQVFTKLVVPSVLPWIISSLRVNIGLALTGAVIGEFIASEQGLGRQILYASQVYDIALIWVAVAILALLSITMYLTIGQVGRMLLKEAIHGSNPQ